MSGSQLICQLPEPFRRLSRLSSPLTAKASTVCTYSLDHITPKGLAKEQLVLVSTIADTAQQERDNSLQVDILQVIQCMLLIYLACIQIVKELGSKTSGKHFNKRLSLHSVFTVSYRKRFGGACRNRTDDILLAKQMLYQLS